MNRVWMTKQIENVLIGGGLDEANARWCANQGYEYYRKTVCNSKDPLAETINYAGHLAETRSLTYKHKQAKPKSKPRAKRPPEAFNFSI